MFGEMRVRKRNRVQRKRIVTSLKGATASPPWMCFKTCGTLMRERLDYEMEALRRGYGVSDLREKFIAYQYEEQKKEEIANPRNKVWQPPAAGMRRPSASAVNQGSTGGVDEHTKPLANGEQRRGFCYRFNKPGGCRFGGACRYKHVRRDKANAATDQGGRRRGGRGGRTVGLTDAEKRSEEGDEFPTHIGYRSGSCGSIRWSILRQVRCARSHFLWREIVCDDNRETDKQSFVQLWH